ncbi:MAG TPA: hypothetical protein VL944_01160 [Candidatus Acidoferrum sp.]|nr:hypothetical protein [Candidatus Acidoferrum sp.]
MKTQPYTVKGIIKKGGQRGFSIEISATSERHASALARAKLGGKHRLRSTSLVIQEVKKGK